MIFRLACSHLQQVALAVGFGVLYGMHQYLSSVLLKGGAVRPHTGAIYSSTRPQISCTAVALFLSW